MDNSLSIYEGSKLEFTLPSGAKAIIREHSAMDDDIITAGSNRGDVGILIKNLNKYVAAILLNNPYDPESKKRITLPEVEKLRLKDKHYIIFKSRIHSIGETIEIEHTCRNESCGLKTDYVVNLLDYDRDLSLEEIEADEDKLAIDRYVTKYDETFFEVEVPSGRKVRLEYLNGVGENFILEHTKRNTLAASGDILARQPKVLVDGEWQEIKSVNIFSKKDAMALTKACKAKDSQFAMTVKIECEACGTVEYIPLITLRGFFFPEEM